MASPKICVLRAPGTNCDVETAFAFETCGGQADRRHLFEVLRNPDMLADYQVLCIPGGFSYGDDIGAGVIFSSQLRGHLADAIGAFLQSDKLVLGICNGFQVLLKAGILPGGGSTWGASNGASRPATLTWNDNGKYTARWVRLGTLAPDNVFLRGISEIELPIAHAEGRFVVREESVLDDWKAQGQIALCYRPWQCGQATGDSSADWLKTLVPYPDNPNGSVGNIAGLGDASGRVLGLMPHPERFLHATQHPQWTRLGLSGEGAGLRIFRNAVEYFG